MILNKNQLKQALKERKEHIKFKTIVNEVRDDRQLRVLRNAGTKTQTNAFTIETTTEKETTTKAETTTKKPETTTKAETTTKKSSVDVNSVAATIAGKTSMFEEPLFQSSGSIGLDIFGIPSSAVSDVAYYVASAAVAEEVLVVKAASSADVSTIKSCIEARRSMQAEDYADYVPKEVPKLNSAITYINGDVIVFCVSNNNSAMRSVISGLV